MYATLPLTDDDAEQLRYIYKKRLKLLLSAFLPMMAVALFLCFETGSPDFQKMNSWSLYRYDPRGFYEETEWGGFLIKTLYIEGLIFIFGYLIYRQRIRPFQTDAQNGLKECLPFTIKMREYFELTDQYFLYFDDPAYLHHEVNAAIFHSLQEGDLVYLFRAPRSKYMFNKRGSFTLI